MGYLCSLKSCTLKRPQFITLFVAILLVAGLFFFGRTVPKEKPVAAAEQHSPDDGHDHSTPATLSIDTILLEAKKNLSASQVVRLNAIENSISRGDVKDQQVHVYHQLARFWADSARIFEPYAWYMAEAARLENSEKTLTFAARLFLDNLQNDELLERRQWKALQARDLFERSLSINPANDSARVGLGACYLFGNISTAPMEGISQIRQVVDKDSSNVYAQMMLSRASLISGQYDKAISRLLTVTRVDSKNAEAMLLLADVYERTGDKANAINWYRKCLPLLERKVVKEAIEKRIQALQ